MPDLKERKFSKTQNIELLQTYLSLLDHDAFEALGTPGRVSGNTQDVLVVASLEAGGKAREANDAGSTIFDTLRKLVIVLQALLGHGNRDSDVVITILQLDSIRVVLMVFNAVVLLNKLHDDVAILTPRALDSTAVDELKDAGDVGPVRKISENDPTRRSGRHNLGCHLLLQVEQTDLLHEVSWGSNTSGFLGRVSRLIRDGLGLLGCFGASGGVVVCIPAFTSFVLGSSRVGSRNKWLSTRINARSLLGGGTRSRGTRSGSLLSGIRGSSSFLVL